MVEQHKRYLRFPDQVARRLAAKLLKGLPDEDPTVVDDFDFDGWHNGYYWAIRMMGERGRLRFPEGHPNAGGLIAGHFVIMAWQGPLSAAPARLRDYVLTDAQIASVFPDGPPEVMG
jgi:hypothetical protein